MSFLGKRFKRTRHENLEELMNTTVASKDMIRMLQTSPPTFCYTKIDDSTFNFVLQTEGKHLSYNFKLGEETEIERRNGEKVKLLFTMPRENVLHETITFRDKKVVYFTREFHDKEGKMTITMDDTDVKAIVYFELVE